MNLNVLLCRHHTADDVISLSMSTGDWFSVEERDAPSDGEVPLDARFDMAIRGTYYQGDTVRYCAYWDYSDRFCFRDNHDQITPLFERARNGKIRALHTSIDAVVEPAKKPSGALEQGKSRFKLVVDGKVTTDVVYESQLFLRLYGADVTPFSDRTLGSWDFFVGVAEAVHCLSSEHTHPEKSETAKHEWANVSLPISQHSGEVCEKNGRWGRVDDLKESHLLWKGERMPRNHGKNVDWVWLGPS
ncbi:hypothetical protein [Denitromonas ohlonensis]|uniref:Uncharacterized protein n=2 Tax=Denitromonas TaxID=139331 RepID=A0A557SPI6_9RHOO|nr:hypothetical protein [Denitromonas ohlonensis]MCZ4305758.1 hypothetical protein [Zoogloeaceae bacterium G21618-S1]TVO65732.1 hypothetical protein FHP90_09560 [Denitromonas ohlonensis]TVO79325.1 hypothetical protein FHP89_00745 [Denitromonas ohlonensis]